MIQTMIKGLMDRLNQMLGSIRKTPGIVISPDIQTKTTEPIDLSIRKNTGIVISPEIKQKAMETIEAIERCYQNSIGELNRLGFSQNNNNKPALVESTDDEMSYTPNFTGFRHQIILVNLCIDSITRDMPPRHKRITEIVQSIKDLNETIVHEQDLNKFSNITESNKRFIGAKTYTEKQISYIKSSMITIEEIKKHIDSLKRELA